MRKRSQLEITYPDVADELEDWAVSRGVARDPYVIGISDAMKTGAELAFWADRDPMEWLPRPRSVTAAKISHRARVVSIIRNVLIFTPVALTWFAIGEATRAFAQFIAAGGETTANFLEFWQDGKGILDEKWRIGNVAMLDFQIIVLLIILSLIAGVMQARSLQISTRDNAIFEDERIALALRISATLNPHRAISDPAMSKSLVLLIDRLERVAKNLDSAGKEMVTSARVLTPKMKSSLGDIEKSASRVKKAATEVQRTSVAINKVAKQIKPSSQRKARG